MDKIFSAQLANIETIRYVDEKLDTYETQSTERISDLMATQDITTVEVGRMYEVDNAVKSLFCKKCSCSKAKKVGDMVMVDLRLKKNK